MLIIHSQALNINLEAKNSLGQSAFNLAFVRKRKRVLELFMTTPGFAWKKSSNGDDHIYFLDLPLGWRIGPKSGFLGSSPTGNFWYKSKLVHFSYS